MPREPGSTRLNFWGPPPLMQELKARSDHGLSEAIREGLTRYFALLAEARRELAGRFTPAELTLLCDITNGTAWEEWSATDNRALLADAEDTEESIYKKWGVDRAVITGKLRDLSRLEHATLVDAIERFWMATGTGMQVDAGKILKK